MSSLYESISRKKEHFSSSSVLIREMLFEEEEEEEEGAKFFILPHDFAAFSNEGPYTKDSLVRIRFSSTTCSMINGIANTNDDRVFPLNTYPKLALVTFYVLPMRSLSNLSSSLVWSRGRYEMSRKVVGTYYVLCTTMYL